MPFWFAACLTLAIAMLPASAARAQDAATKPILLPPPLQWDRAMLTNKPALQQNASDLANLTDGIVFGMSPSKVNSQLPDPFPGLTWSALPEASEYSGEVRYFWSRFDAAAPLLAGLTACAGQESYVVFLFSSRGLFRLSYRLLPDKDCPDPAQAARQIFARYVPIGPVVALSAHYRAGTAEVVDVTDPTAGVLIQTRWRKGLK